MHYGWHWAYHYVKILAPAHSPSTQSFFEQCFNRISSVKTTEISILDSTARYSKIFACPRCRRAQPPGRENFQILDRVYQTLY